MPAMTSKVTALFLGLEDGEMNRGFKVPRFLGGKVCIVGVKDCILCEWALEVTAAIVVNELVTVDGLTLEAEIKGSVLVNNFSSRTYQSHQK